MSRGFLVSVIVLQTAFVASAAGLRHLPPLVVTEGSSIDIRSEGATSVRSSNSAIATVSLPNGGVSIVNGCRMGAVEITFNDQRGPFASQTLTVVPSYWETLRKFFEDDPEITVTVSGDKVIVSGRTSSHETIRRVEQSKSFDPDRIVSHVTYSVPSIAIILQTYIRHIGYSNVTAAAVGNEICLTGKLFDKQAIENVQKRSKEFLTDFPSIGVNADGLKVFNQRIVLDVELIKYDVIRAQNLGIQWPSSISVDGKFSYGWDLDRTHAENNASVDNYNDTATRTSTSTLTGGKTTTTAESQVNNVLNRTLNLSDTVNRNDTWKMNTGVSVDGVRMTVNLLKQNGVSKTLYKTSIATQSGEEAKFQNGGTIHRNTQGTFSSGDLKQIEYGFIIKALPRIVDEKTVNLVVDLDNKQPLGYTPGRTSVNEDINVSRYQTRSQYMVRPGETILVSGFNQVDESDEKQGLPWFCQIPWIGKWLFGNTNLRNDKSEVVLVVTVNWALENESEAAIRRRDEIRDRAAEIGMP